VDTLEEDVEEDEREVDKALEADEEETVVL